MKEVGVGRRGRERERGEEEEEELDKKEGRRGREYQGLGDEGDPFERSYDLYLREPTL